MSVTAPPCYLCLRPVVEPATTWPISREIYIRDPRAPALCAGCRVEIGRPFERDEARAKSAAQA
jgi:hypothetical protein